MSRAYFSESDNGMHSKDVKHTLFVMKSINLFKRSDNFVSSVKPTQTRYDTEKGNVLRLLEGVVNLGNVTGNQEMKKNESSTTDFGRQFSNSFCRFLVTQERSLEHFPRIFQNT